VAFQQIGFINKHLILAAALLIVVMSHQNVHFEEPLLIKCILTISISGKSPQYLQLRWGIVLAQNL
jgi:hypothetical protein